MVAETNQLRPLKSDLRGSLRSCHSRCSHLVIKIDVPIKLMKIFTGFDEVD